MVPEMLVYSVETRIAAEVRPGNPPADAINHCLRVTGTLYFTIKILSQINTRGKKGEGDENLS